MKREGSTPEGQIWDYPKLRRSDLSLLCPSVRPSVRPADDVVALSLFLSARFPLLFCSHKCSVGPSALFHSLY